MSAPSPRLVIIPLALAPVSFLSLILELYLDLSSHLVLTVVSRPAPFFLCLLSVPLLFSPALSFFGSGLNPNRTGLLSSEASILPLDRRSRHLPSQPSEHLSGHLSFVNTLLRQLLLTVLKAGTMGVR